MPLFFSKNVPSELCQSVTLRSSRNFMSRCNLQQSEGISTCLGGLSVLSALDAAGSRVLEESADGVAILKAWGRLS